MKNVEKNAKAVEKLFLSLEKAGKNFSEKSTLSCPTGCTLCCRSKNISATALEFLPYAWAKYKSGELESKYWELKTQSKEHCLLLSLEPDALTGGCGEYVYRGLTCRLFGYASMLDKHGKKQYVGCKILKETVATNDLFANQVVAHSPVYAEYYMQLRAIDLESGSMLYPINIAIIKSMEIVFNSTRRRYKRSG